MQLGVGGHAIAVPALALRADVPLSTAWSAGAMVSAGRSDRATVFEHVLQLSAGVAGHRWLLGDQATGLALTAQLHARHRRSGPPTEPAFGTQVAPSLRASGRGLLAALGVTGRKQVGRLSIDGCVSAARTET